MQLNEWLAARRADYRSRLAYELVSGGAAPERARALRNVIETTAETLDDGTALEAVELFPGWESGVPYEAGQRVRYAPQPSAEGEAQGAKLYKCVQAHTSQADWTPDVTPALWTAVAAPGEIPVWVQPTGAQDAYQTGDRVRYPDADGPVWVSEVDDNVWEPGVYGWAQLTIDDETGKTQ